MSWPRDQIFSQFSPILGMEVQNGTKIVKFQIIFFFLGPRIRYPWREGNYKGKGFIDSMVIAGNAAEATMLTTGEKTRMSLSQGVFGEADPEIVKMTGERVYTVEARYPVRERERVLYGVVTKEGFSLVFHTFVGLWELDWVTEEEADRLANEGDPILAPTSSYPMQPERQGKLLWITGFLLSKTSYKSK